MFYYIIYQSIPTGEVTPVIIDKITDEAIKWNEAHEITGILIYHDQQYFQYLEGEESEVVKVFKMIKNDPRHHGVQIKVMGFTKHKVFKEWSMGSWIIGPKIPTELKVLGDLEEYLKDPINDEMESTKYIEMMHNLLTQWQAQKKVES